MRFVSRRDQLRGRGNGSNLPLVAKRKCLTATLSLADGNPEHRRGYGGFKCRRGSGGSCFDSRCVLSPSKGVSRAMSALINARAL